MNPDLLTPALNPRVPALASVNVRELKERRALNWSALARQLGVHPSYIHHTLANRQKFRNSKVRRAITKALGVPLDALFPPEAA